MQPTDLLEFFVQFQDYLAPKLDTYEQAIYLYIFRKGRLLGLDEVTIGFTLTALALLQALGNTVSLCRRIRAIQGYPRSKTKAS
jgi:hypothetical protein